MGLSIRVPVSISVIESLLDDDGVDDTAVRAQLNRVIDVVPVGGGDSAIVFHPGGYSGLHTLRAEYARVKRLKFVSNPGSTDIDYKDKDVRKSHLLNHSDSDGWYIPEEFPDPILLLKSGTANDYLSIGSSNRLLAELMEISATLFELQGAQEIWDGVFLCAAASVLTRTPIEFT